MSCIPPDHMVFMLFPLIHAYMVFANHMIKKAYLLGMHSVDTQPHDHTVAECIG